jgi:hypothetical protein
MIRWKTTGGEVKAEREKPKAKVKKISKPLRLKQGQIP